jgi:hypothetical protein
MENDNNDIVVAPTLEATETTQELSQDQLGALVAALKNAQPTNFKARFQGIAGTAKRVDKSWHNGKLITTEERNKLSWEDIHASNNVVRKG